MHSSKMKRQILSAAVSAALAAVSIPAGAAASEVVTIDPHTGGSAVNEGVFEGWGTSLCWWANRLGYSEVLTEKAAKAFFDPEEGLGMNIARYNIGGGDDPSHDHITRTDSMIPGYAVDPVYDADAGTYSWSYDWDADRNQRNVLQKAMEAYGEGFIAEAFSNSPPYFMTVSGCSSGGEDPGEDNLRADAFDAFAEYLAEVALHFKDEWGITFQSITAMNEPCTNYWSAYSNKQEGCHFSQGASQSRMITALRAALDGRGMADMLISASDETSIDTQALSWRRLSDEAKEAVARIDTHSYQGTMRGMLRKAALDAGKNLWMSEVDGGDTAGVNAGEMGAGLWLANRILEDMNGLTPSAWILWQVIDSHISKDGYLGRKDTGMVNTAGGYWGTAVADHDREELILTMKYYVLGQFTRYIRPGYRIIEGGQRSIAAYDPGEKTLVIVAVNARGNDADTRFDLSAFEEAGSEVEVIRTSGSMEEGEHWAQLESFQPDVAGFDAVLKANSVTTFLVRNVVY